MSPDLLQQCLGDQPATLEMLVLTSAPVEQVQQWLLQAYPSRIVDPQVHAFANDIDLNDIDLAGSGQRRWPLVCLLQPFQAGKTDKPVLTRLLAKLRDLHADRVIHIENHPQGCSDDAGDSLRWTMSDSLALGFTRRVVKNSSVYVSVFEFDIHTYKPAPDWLNAKHWANPERWGKHHW